MIEAVLQRKSVSLKTKLTIKGLVSVGLIVCAVLLPRLAHIVGGASAGAKWLPMYLPVLVAGCLLGTYWGLGVGILSPVVSFLLTSIFGDPMPALARLPFMMAELAVFAAVSGLFGKKIADNKWLAFPAVLVAELSGRTFFVALAAIFQGVSSINATMAWAQIQTGAIGLVVQALIAPLIVIGLNYLMSKNKSER